MGTFMLCHSVLEVCKVLILWGLIGKGWCLVSEKIMDLEQSSKNSWGWTECILHYEMVVSLWGAGVECYGLDLKCSLNLTYFEGFVPTAAMFRGRALGDLGLMRALTS
jgi:hypothetical protein